LTKTWAAPLSINRADTSSYSILTGVDLDNSLSLLPKHTKIRRLIMDLGVNINFINDDFSNDEMKSYTLFWGVYIADHDDGDITAGTGVLSGAVQTLLHSNRFLHVGQLTLQHSRYVNSFDGSNHNYCREAPSIRFDWKGNANIKTDEELILTVNIDFDPLFADDHFDNEARVALYGYTRVLTKTY